MPLAVINQVMEMAIANNGAVGALQVDLAWELNANALHVNDPRLQTAMAYREAAAALRRARVVASSPVRSENETRTPSKYRLAAAAPVLPVAHRPLDLDLSFCCRH